MSNPDHGPDERTQAFLHTLTDADSAAPGPRQLGTTTLARRLGLPDDQLGGHWCSRCRGIWYGCALEVECPRCGNRHG
jgi:hypothetical protein